MNSDKLVLGGFEVYGLRDGYFRLDGGTMFGVVPKVLWEKKFPSDKKNRIRLSLNSLLVCTEKALVLVETGIGTKLDPKSTRIYGYQREPGLVDSLKRTGYSVEDVNFVINTHLHFDHCGSNTCVDDEGKFVPTFPRAQYVIQKGEWDHALRPNERDRKSFLEENYVPLQEHGVLNRVDGDKEITEGIEVIVVPGHTMFHQCVKIQSKGETLFFLGDLVPTSAHIGLAYIMSYDLYPLETLKNKKKVYTQALEEDWVFGFCHDPDFYFGKITKEGENYSFQPV